MQDLNGIEMLYYLEIKDNQKILNNDSENMDIKIDDKETEDKKEKFYFDN